jgi:hypothetical protein
MLKSGFVFKAILNYTLPHITEPNAILRSKEMEQVAKPNAEVRTGNEIEAKIFELIREGSLRWKETIVVYK